MQTNWLFAQDDEAVEAPFVWIIMFRVITEKKIITQPITVRGFVVVLGFGFS